MGVFDFIQIVLYSRPHGVVYGVGADDVF